MLTTDALQFIHAFAPIISKAAMQTYYSALPLMSSESFLFKTYSAMSRPSLKLSESSYLQIIEHPQILIQVPEDLFYYNYTSSDEIIALSHQGGITFFDTRTGNKIGSGIHTQGSRFTVFSPDGKWVAHHDHVKCVLEVWDVKTCTCVKTIETTSNTLDYITYSADGEKVIVFARSASFTFHRWLILVLDVKTDKPSKQLEVELLQCFTISPNGSQIAFINELGTCIKIINISTGHIAQQKITPLSHNDINPISIVWSPNDQFLASVSKNHKNSKTELNLLSLTHHYRTTQVLEESTRKIVVKLACSPDSLKVVVVLWDYEEHRMSIYIYCTQSLGRDLLGTTSFEFAQGNSETKAAISFAADSQDILISAYNLFTSSPILHCRFSVVHLESCMNHLPKFHPSQTPCTIQYSHHISGAIDDYASHVDSDGWIVNMKGRREIWTPWANYELLCSCKPPPKGQTQYRTLEVKDPETKTVVLIYVIAFKKT